jgi:hypothetical protein
MVSEQIHDFLSAGRIALKESLEDKVFLGMMNQVREMKGILHDLFQDVEIRNPAASIERQLLVDDPEELAHPAMFEVKLLENSAHSRAHSRRLLPTDTKF